MSLLWSFLFSGPNPRLVLTKDLLRVSRRGGGYQPRFVDEGATQLAARVLGCYQGHVGEPRSRLQETLEELEHESDDFKLVRGFAKLLDREATWAVESPVEPRRARVAAFEASEAVGVVGETERERALERAAARLEVPPEAIETSLYADLESRERLEAFETRFDPTALVDQYNLSLAQTALFDATELRVRSLDPKRVVAAVKRLRLMYEVRRLPESERRTVANTDREVVVTGPDGLFRSTRRYGTRFARLLRTVATAEEFRVEATIDDRGTERELVVTDADISVPGVEPVVEVGYDSGVEESFARRFESLDFEWELRREPDPLAAGEHVVIPDFAFDWPHEAFRVYFEIMGFWTPEYVETKLARLADIDDVELLVAVDESLGVGEAIETRDHRAIGYTGSVSIRDVRNALRRYERRLTEAAAAGLPDRLRPDADVVSLADLATRHGVSSDALEGIEHPEHERVGQTLVRPAVLEAIDAELESGMDVETAQSVLETHGIEETAVFSHLGYRVEWEGLGGGVLRDETE